MPSCYLSHRNPYKTPKNLTINSFLRVSNDQKNITAVVSLVYFPLAQFNNTKKEERDITTAIMNIVSCQINQKYDSSSVVSCPHCNCTYCPKHGHYIRKGFHSKASSSCFQVEIQHYRCKNKLCKHASFSVLPPMVLRYCRFFWPCLLAVWTEIKSLSPMLIAISHTWNVGIGVIKRATGLYFTIHEWVSKQYQEQFDSCKIRSLAFMVKRLFFKTGLTDLMNRWYWYHYPTKNILT